MAYFMFTFLFINIIIGTCVYSRTLKYINVHTCTFDSLEYALECQYAGDGIYLADRLTSGITKITFPWFPKGDIVLDLFPDVKEVFLTGGHCRDVSAASHVKVYIDQTLCEVSMQNTTLYFYNTTDVLKAKVCFSAFSTYWVYIVAMYGNKITDLSPIEHNSS